MTIKNCLLLILGALAALPTKGDLVDFHFGGLDQTGPAVVGTASDVWNQTSINKGGPVVLQNTQGVPTTISLSWTSGDAWAAPKAITANTSSTVMDPATSWLMRSFAASYQYYSTPTNLTLSFTGLTPNQSYTLILLAAGDQIHEGTLFTITGSGTYTGSTTGLSRKLSAGEGNAYATISVVSSATGTLKITTDKSGYGYAVLNGFQLTSATSSAANEAPAVTPITASVPTATVRTIAWGICGHPTWSDYADWVPANLVTEMGYLNQLGCKYYRCSFEGAEYPAIMDTNVPKAQAAGITILPILPLTLTASATATTNYNTNYQTGYTWATYAITKKYALPHWEIGNELENDGLVDVVYDGASPNDFPDAQPGGFVAIASGLSGAYQGIKDAYTAGRASGLTTITPQVLYGATYRHWGLLAKIQTYNGTLPCDMISWHWYGPNYGAFNLPISDKSSVSNGLTPGQALGQFKSKTDPTQPMNIWITETNRSAEVDGHLQNGSTGSDTAPAANQDWADEATAIQNNVDSFKAVPSVTGIFVYELFDETKADSSSTALLASEGYFGLMTGLNGVQKPAFTTYQNEIKQWTATQSANALSLQQ